MLQGCFGLQTKECTELYGNKVWTVMGNLSGQQSSSAPSYYLLGRARTAVSSSGQKEGIARLEIIGLEVPNISCMVQVFFFLALTNQEQ